MFGVITPLRHDTQVDSMRYVSSLKRNSRTDDQRLMSRLIVVDTRDVGRWTKRLVTRIDGLGMPAKLQHWRKTLLHGSTVSRLRTS
jgi:hypothetical protein